MLTNVGLGLETVKELDAGRVSVAFAHELRRVVLDCLDRPAEKKERTVTLTVRVKPEVTDDGQCESAKARFQIASKVPQRESKAYDFGVTNKGHLFFQAEAEDPATDSQSQTKE
ncbi:MAG: hypothetical protein KGL35_27245 [Bradyrhizobium sp.]|nr:hypothetical protein [Bradyrhizobium sp.]